MSKMNVDEFHCVHGHAGEQLLILAARRSGVELVGDMKPCVLRSMAKRVLRGNIHNTSRADKYEIRKGGTRARTWALNQPRAAGPLALLRPIEEVGLARVLIAKKGTSRSGATHHLVLSRMPTRSRRHTLPPAHRDTLPCGGRLSLQGLKRCRQLVHLL